MYRLTLLSWHRNWIAPALVVCGLLAFAPNLNSFFLSDDFVLLSWTHIHSLSAVPAFFDPHANWFYRPLVKLVYWAGQLLFGFHAVPFHILSLALHGANAYLIYSLLKQAGGWSSWLAGMAAALVFLLDPHHAETVSWISAVGDLMGLFCVLANLLLFRRYMERGSYLALAGALALFGIGLLARETVALLPGLLLFYVLTKVVEVKSRWQRLLPAYAAHVAVLLAYFLVQSAGRTNGQSILARGGLQFHPLNLDSILLGILDYSHGLVPGGSVFAGSTLDTLKALVWIEWAIMLIIAFFLWRLKLHMALFGLAWLLFTPLAFVFFSPATDRYFYMPSVGYAILVGSLLGSALEWAQKRDNHAAIKATGAAVAVALLLLLVTRGVGLVGKVLEWRAAGQVSGGVLHDIRQTAPAPHDYTAYYMVNLPIFREGIPVFQNGLQEAVQLTYDNNTTLAVHATNCASLQDAAGLPRYSLFFQYKENGAQQFSSTKDCGR